MQTLKTLLALFGLTLPLTAAHAQEAGKPDQSARIQTVGRVGDVSLVQTGFQFTEGPAADHAGNVYFSDIPANKIYKVDAKGKVSTFLEDTQGCNGLAFDARGNRLVACQGGAGKVIAVDIQTKETTVLAAEFEGKSFQKPNDLSPDPSGGVYFTDPPAGAVYYITPDGAVRRVAADLANPNGVLVTPGGGTLYVLPSRSPEVLVYEVLSPGSVGDREVLVRLDQAPDAPAQRGGDGLAVDRKGNLYIAQPDLMAIQVVSPGGKTLGFIRLPQRPSNCTFGGADGHTLFVTAQTSLYRVQIIPDPPKVFDPYPIVLLGVGILFIFVMILWLKVNAFLALIGAALLLGLLSPRVVMGGFYTDPVLNLVHAPEVVAFRFGDTMRKIGLAIAFATIIGKAMMESGAADRIVRFFTNLFGDRFAPFALLTSGFVLSIPVFFDTVFLLLVPLAKALRIRTGKDYLLYVAAIGAGGAVSHSLVPPTPGPIAMSAELHVTLGLTIVIGILIGFPIALVGFLYARWINTVSPVPLREEPERLRELEERARFDTKQLPPLWVSLLPILLPVLFITSDTVVGTLVKSGSAPYLAAGLDAGGFTVRPASVLNFLGEPSIALLISAVVSMLIVRGVKKMSRRELGVFTTKALDDAGMILLITSAGGAFGGILQEIGVGQSLGTLADGAGIPLLVLGWGLAALFKVAQGSGTVAMITTAQIMAGILAAKLGTTADQMSPAAMGQFLGYHPVYLVMAIGAGSKVGSWMNDSGFWVVCRMGGLTEGETFKSWTVCLCLMGVAGLPLVWLAAYLLPMV